MDWQELNSFQLIPESSGRQQMYLNGRNEFTTYTRDPWQPMGGLRNEE